MNLSEPFIKRPVMTILVMASIFFLGLFTYGLLPVSEMPNVDMPTIEVSVTYPGANPDTIANAITTPHEQQFMTIEGIQSIFSTSSSGSSTIVLQFDLNRNIDDASIDVQAALSQAQSNLPANLPSQPTYNKVNPSNTPILYYAITSSTMTLSQLYDYGNTFIGKRLSMIDGVAQVVTWGAPYAVRVQIDPEKLAAKNISLSQVTQSIQNTNVDLPLGTLYGDRDDFIVNADGQILRAPGYSELTIKNDNGDLVKIKDVGRALDSTQNDKLFQHYITQETDEQCIVLAIQRIPGKNSVRIIEKIKSTLEILKPQLPSSLKLYTIYDKSEAIVESVNEVKTTIIIALILVIFVIYLSLGKALNTIIPAISLPLCIFGTFTMMYLFGFSLDILSLLAITLSMGFLVDDAVVVLENTVRHIQMGESPMEASLKGSREISITVLSMTVCLAAAFIPLLFMGGVVGKLFREFAFTIVFAVLISGFIALSLIPMMSSRLIKPYREGHKTRMERITDATNEHLKKIYKPCLLWALAHRLTMLAIGISSIAFSLLLFSLIPKDFLPPDDVGFLQGYTLSRDGTSPLLMDKYHQQINAMTIKDPNVETILSICPNGNSNEGSLFIRLKPFKERIPMNGVIDKLTDQLGKFPGINVYLSPLPLIDLQVGTTGRALYQYSLTSIDKNALYAYAPKLLIKMKELPILTQVSSDQRDLQPQWQLHILRDRAANYNISVSDIENYLQYAYSGNRIGQINSDINQYDLLIETLPKFYKDPSVLSKLYIQSPGGDQVPLSELVQVKETAGPLTINHINGLTSVAISFNLADGVPLGTAISAINEITKKEIPVQVYGQTIGTADVFQSSFASLKLLLLLAFFVIYVVLGILYESFIHPITVMSTLPPALFGGLLTLYLFNQTLSLYSFVGLILLIGIVLKNGIIMIDFANEAVIKEKKSAYDAIIEACLTRFRPILMTTICAMMGALPIALGMGGALAQNHKSLGFCIVGGLLVSQMLTLLLTPVLYTYFEIMQENLYKRLGKIRE